MAPLGAADRRVDRLHFAAGRVDREARAGRCAPRSSGSAAALRRGSGGIGVGLDPSPGRFPDRRRAPPGRRRAEVEGTGDGRGDEGEAERRALVGTGEVGLAGGVEGAGAGAGAAVTVPIWLAAGQEGLASSAAPLLPMARGDRGVRAVGDALQRGGEALRRGQVDGAEFLFAVVAGQVQDEGAGLTGAGGFGAGVEARAEGARRRAVGAGASRSGRS